MSILVGYMLALNRHIQLLVDEKYKCFYRKYEVIEVIDLTQVN